MLASLEQCVTLKKTICDSDRRNSNHLCVQLQKGKPKTAWSNICVDSCISEKKYMGDLYSVNMEKSSLKMVI